MDEKHSLKILVNAFSGFGVAFVYLYLLIFGMKTGTSWYTERIQSFGDNHLIIFLLFGPFLFIQALLLVRRPFESWNSGLFRAVMEFFLYFTTANSIWSLGYYVSAHQLQAIIWIELLPIVFITVIVLSEERGYITVLKIEVLFAFFILGYIALWLTIGFPTSAGLGHTIFYDNLGVNLIEIGYWAFSMVSWLASYFVVEFKPRKPSRVITGI